MKRIKLEDYEIINDEIIFPIEIYDCGFIINPDEMLFSTKYKIDKNKVNLNCKKAYANDTISQFQMTLDQYRKHSISFRKFNINQIYLMQNISFFDAGYRYDFMFFRKEEDGIYAYYYNILEEFEQYNLTYIVNRAQLESIFSYDGLDGQYMGNATTGLTYAYNKKDGLLEKQEPLLTDEEIVEKYNEKMKFFSRLHDNKYTPKTIEEIQNYNITGEMFEKQEFLIKVSNGKIIFTRYGLLMLKQNIFKLNIELYNLMYFKNKLLTQTNTSDIKRLIYKEGE